MAIATVFVIPSNIEPVFWLAIFLVCAFLIARKQPDRHFLHGLLVGIVNSVWVTGAHILFFSQYIANHPKEAAMMTTMPLSNHPRLMMACVGPIVGVISGLIIGLLAFVAGRTVKPAVTVPA
jgi:thiamine transporter ThiT